MTEQAVLLVSELVTNAVLHARTRFTVEVEVVDDTARVSVEDSSPLPPAVRTFSDLAGSGRGLHLVEALASRWGVDSRDGAGKRVWFELDLSAAGAVFDLDAVEPL